MPEGAATRWLIAALTLASALAAVVFLGRGPAMTWTMDLSLPPVSNIERADYVGPEVCAECHSDKSESWQRHLHRTMNARPGLDTIVAPFGGERVDYGGGSARFVRTGERFFVEMRSRAGVARRFEVTRTIGSHFIQELVGRQVEGPEPSGHEIYRRELRLPFGYWRRKARWFHQQYYDSWFGPEYEKGVPAFDPYQPDLESWESRCPWCHNTYAFDLRLVRSQAKGVGHGIEKSFELLSPAMERARFRSAASGQLPLDELVTVGISCESCHLGGRQHAEDGQSIAFGPRHPRVRDASGQSLSREGRSSPAVRNGLCAQCHSAPSPRYPDGGARRNSSEALDMATSTCAPSISCTDCHDPHVRGSSSQQSAQRAACIGCHQELAADARAHARHDPSEADCLDCHMPKIVQGFSSVIRTHRITKAFDPTMVAASQPNACNLCHLDRSFRWAARAVEMYWGRRVAAPAGERSAGEVWLQAQDPHLMVTAAAAYARSPLGGAVLPKLVARLDQPIAYYRMRMLFAIEDIIGRELRASEYEPMAEPQIRARAVRRLRLEKDSHAVENPNRDERR